MACVFQLTGPVLDLIYKVKALPLSGQEAVVTGFSVSPGGGFNAMVAARAAGMDVALAGSLGTGPLASVIALDLARYGIALARPAILDFDQGCCVVMIEPNGERSFVASPGAEGHIRRDWLAQVAPVDGDWVILSGYTLVYPESAQSVSDWVALLPDRVHVLFDPSPLADQIAPGILAKVMARADWISANEVEAAMLSGAAAPDQPDFCLAAERKGGAIVRQGDRGATLITGGRKATVPAHPVRALDTNGAGDTHIGSFIARLSLTGDPLDALHYANIAAALSTTVEGPATAPPRDRVLALLTPHSLEGR